MRCRYQNGLTLIEMVTVLVILVVLANAVASIGVSPQATTDMVELRRDVTSSLTLARGTALTAADPVSFPGQQVTVDFSDIDAGYASAVSVDPEQLTFTYPLGALDDAQVPEGQGFVNVVLTAGDLQASICVRALTGRVVEAPCAP